MLAQFKVFRVGVDFFIGEKSAPRHPVILHPRGVIFLPVSDFLHERKAYNDASDGGILDEAYILCAWLNYLHARGLNWKDASDVRIQDHADSLLAKKIQKARVQRCADVIFRFYWTAQNVLDIIQDIIEDPHKGKSGPQYPITVHYSAKGGLQGRFQFTTVPKGSGRPTPEEPQVEQILDQLLDRTNLERATCFWLSASLMYRSGLREEGVSSLSLKKLAQALREEGINKDGRAYDLHGAALNPELQDKILNHIGKISARGRSKIFIKVKEKGRRERDVGVPIDLFENILFYIWSARAALVTALYSRRRNYKGSHALFLSLKTGSGLQKKSIGNLINATFRTLGIRGSAHRLRAAFAESVARDCYLRARAAHGAAWDRNAVLLEIAEALGHQSTRTLGRYLNRIIREQELIKGEPILVTSPSYVDDVRAMVDFINDGNSQFASDMRALLAKHGHTPKASPVAH